MKKFNATYYLLFVILIMGAFAAMAQNDYGTTLMGLVAAAFCLTFLIQLVSAFTAKKASGWLNRLELISLVVMSMLISLRVFYIHFAFVEIIFGVAGAIFTLVYLSKLISTFQSLSKKNLWLALAVASFHLSIILFTLAMTVVPLLPWIVEPTGMAAFGLLLVFGVGHFMNRKIMLDGEETSVFQTVKQFQDRSILLCALFLAFSLYLGFTKFGMLPRIYSDEFPQSYFQLIKEAETGMEKPVKGKFKHEEFKAKYERFVERNTTVK